mmetsp:Transcript_18483/g.29320  ORF Transcript_18483/g.29320 Transcript_18483/m.29320 type:complete len:226 (-) Transcript_18483:98-775(-)
MEHVELTEVRWRDGRSRSAGGGAARTSGGSLILLQIIEVVIDRNRRINRAFVSGRGAIKYGVTALVATCFAEHSCERVSATIRRLVKNSHGSSVLAIALEENRVALQVLGRRNASQIDLHNFFLSLLAARAHRVDVGDAERIARDAIASDILSGFLRKDYISRAVIIRINGLHSCSSGRVALKVEGPVGRTATDCLANAQTKNALNTVAQWLRLSICEADRLDAE